MTTIINKVRWAAIVLTMLLLVPSCDGKDVEAPANEPYLRLEGPREITVSEEGITQEYVVKSDGKWEVIRKSTQTWAEAKPVSGQNDGSFRITVGKNNNYSERSMRFTFMLNGKELPQEEVLVVQGKASLPEQSFWDEGDQNLTVVKHGAPAYSATRVTYRRDEQPIMDVELQDPVVLAVATKQEAWGYFQSPSIYKSRAGTLVAYWKNHADVYEHTGESIYMLSNDGETWFYPTQSQSVPSGGSKSANVYLPGGDLLSARYVTFKKSDLQLPASIASHVESYGAIYTYYRVSELPTALQGVYLARRDPNDAITQIHANLYDPGLARWEDGNTFPIIWWGDMILAGDNSVVSCQFATAYERTDGGVDPMSVTFYRTTDEGMNWNVLGKIPFIPDATVDLNGSRRKVFGFDEPAFEILSDGTYFCVMRSTSGYGLGPMYFSRSSDQGVTWSNPETFTPSGVRPRLQQLGNGVLVLASGRPGVQLRFSIDGKGEKWTDPFEMVPFTDTEEVSSGYSEILVTGPDRFLLIYDDFKHVNQNHEERKAIKIREVKVTKR